MATHPSILAWKIPGWRSLVGLVHGVEKSLTRLSNFTFFLFFLSGLSGCQAPIRNKQKKISHKIWPNKGIQLKAFEIDGQPGKNKKLKAFEMEEQASKGSFPPPASMTVHTSLCSQRGLGTHH